MAEKITLKNALANLPQKTDVDSIVAKDASGNPVFIKKSDLAQVVAELIPVATTTTKGLMSANDKKYSVQYINFPHNQSRKILQVDGDYYQFVCVGFLLSGSSPFNFILSGRSETNNRFSINLGKINDGGGIKIYKKENSFYLSNQNVHDKCTGFLISTHTIGTDDVTIDDSFELLK